MNLTKNLLIVVILIMTTLFSAFSKGQKADLSKQESVELSFIHNMLVETEGGTAVAFNNALEHVKELYPELVIKEEGLAASSYHTKIKTLAAGNELPDLYIIRGSMLDTLIENELIQSIGADLNSDVQWENGFLPGTFDVFKRGDEIFGVPLSAKSTSIVFYNKEIFREVGIDKFPETHKAFVDAVKKLKSAGYTPIALGNQDKWVVNSCIMSTLGDRFTGTDWLKSIKEGTGAKFTDPEFVNFLTALKELADIGAFNSDMNSIDNMQQKTLYYQKKAAMFIEGAWAIGNISSDAPEDVRDTTGLAIFPPVEGGKGEAKAFSGGASLAFGINADLKGRKREIAIEILKNLSNSVYGATLAENNKFPAVIPGYFDESNLSDLTREYNVMLENTVFTPVYDIHLTPPVIEVMNITAQELLIDLITPEEMAAKIQKEYESTK